MKKQFLAVGALLVALNISAAFAAMNVNQLVNELGSDVANSNASPNAKARITNALKQCSTQPTTNAVCGCLNANLPSRAHRVINKCNSLSSD